MTESLGSLESFGLDSRLQAVYLDTNVFNALADALTYDEVEKLATAFRSLGIQVAVSPVNLWEVILTGDGKRKDDLVWVMQHVSSLPLLPEVETIVARQIAEIVGGGRRTGLGVGSGSRLAREWELTRRDRRRTLYLTEGRDSIQGMKVLHRLIHAVASRGLSQVTFAKVLERARARGGSPGRGQAGTLTAAIKKEMRDVMRRAPTYEPVYGEVAAMVAALMLMGLTPFPDPIDAAVRELGGALVVLNDPDLLRPLLQQGSVMALASVTEQHARERYSAGNWLDGYHLQYLQVVPDLYTRDGPLLDLCKRQGSGGRLVERVHDAEPLIERVVALAKARSG